MTSLLPHIENAGRVRWLLPGSLALNLLFVGATGAVALRYAGSYTGSVPLSTVTRIDHSATDRLSRLAATLPLNDARAMRSELRADARKVAAAQADLRLSQEQVRDRLRAERFDPDALRFAMAQVQAARENYHLVVHNVIAAAAVKMSDVGRNKLADWRALRGGT